MATIYVLENIVNNKMYIGQTIKLKERLQEHFKSNGKKFVIGRAINKHGQDNFKKHIFYVPQCLLNYFEIEMIRHLNTIIPNGYNVLPGGHLSSGMKGKNHTKETKKKISEATKGKRPSEETKQKMSETRIGKKHTEETKQNISKNHADMTGKNNPMYGKKHTEKTKRKMSENHIDVSSEKNPMYGKKHTEETKQKISEAMFGKRNPKKKK